MLTRRLGGKGPIVSALGAGCWAIGGPGVNLDLPMGWGQIDDGTAIRALERAHELGVTLYDTADVYGHGRSERLIGSMIAAVPRESVVLSSKVGYFRGTASHGYEPRHIRRQLEQTLDNLGTDHLDLYFLHNNEFGPQDEFLDGAVAAMAEFRAEGMIRAVGMRGPHRYAPDRVTGTSSRVDKVERFHHLFDRIHPDVLAVRDNLLTPARRSAGLFAFAAERSCGVLINKPLAQGLLTGSHHPDAVRVFGAGDHRSRKRWFTPDGRRVIEDGLAELRAIVGPETRDLVRLALWACLDRGGEVAVLVGFTSAEQVDTNFGCLGDRPSADSLIAAREIMARVQNSLDTTGQVFLDERESPRVD